MDTPDFADWLNDQLKKHNMTKAELARRAKVTRQVISTYTNRKRKKPDEIILRQLAHGLNVSIESVYRAAGILDPIPPNEETFDEWLHVLRQLPQKDRDELLAFARLKLDLQHQAQPTPKTTRDGQPRLELIKGKI